MKHRKDPEKVKQKILLMLKTRGKMSTTDIAMDLKENYWRAVVLLEKLEDKKIIKRSFKGSFCYWELDNKKELTK